MRTTGSSFAEALGVGAVAGVVGGLGEIAWIALYGAAQRGTNRTGCPQHCQFCDPWLRPALCGRPGSASSFTWAWLSL